MHLNWHLKKLVENLDLGSTVMNKQHLHSRHLASYLAYDSESIVRA
jgi:hypothetical protein